MDTPTKLYELVMEQLRSKRIPQKKVALESGVPYSTVCKIAQGAVTDPSVHTAQRLADYFHGKNSQVSPPPDLQERRERRKQGPT
jgi:transcriptional regulator with XRE-family HTH domain